jgi:tRNA-Thr(GGU) m(6)t(6)A37 methyltransferase TsaA
MEMKSIATIHTDFAEKFGIPRQSGLVAELKGEIVFQPEYRNPDALRGLDGYSYIWLVWEFSEAVRENWTPTVRPPRLGGDTRMGVFATRSPFRPNPIGLSSVRLDGIDWEDRRGPVLHVSGADLMNGTPIYDIKPFLPHVDNHPDATGGFAGEVADYHLQVEIPKVWENCIPESKRDAVRGVLAQDPRPSYQNDPDRVYGMNFAGMNIRFRVAEGILTVCEVEGVRKD